MSQIEEKLHQLGYTLPSPPSPGGNYVRTVRTGNLIFLAGTAPRRPDGTRVQGKLGQDLSTEEGYEAARLCALNLLASLKEATGDLDNVARIVKLLGMVNSTPDFGDQPKVINGASDLLVELFGENGRHARSAVGMTLPGGIAVEIEMIVEVAG